MRKQRHFLGKLRYLYLSFFVVFYRYAVNKSLEKMHSKDSGYRNNTIKNAWANHPKDNR